MRCEGSSQQQKPAAGKIYMTSVKHQHLDFLGQSVTGKPGGLTGKTTIAQGKAEAEVHPGKGGQLTTARRR